MSFTDTVLQILSIEVNDRSVSGAGSEIEATNGHWASNRRLKVLAVGDKVTFNMNKDPATDLVNINISLGGSDFFPQLKEVPSEKVMTIQIYGQGLSLPATRAFREAVEGVGRGCYEDEPPACKPIVPFSFLCYYRSFVKIGRYWIRLVS